MLYETQSDNFFKLKKQTPVRRELNKTIGIRIANTNLLISFDLKIH